MNCKEYHLIPFKIFILVLLGLSPGILLAQAEQVIKGTITESDNKTTLPGVTIQIQGEADGTISSGDGTYQLRAAKGKMLVFSFIGYESQQVLVGNQTVINIVMQSSATALEEMVVIGYGTAKKSDLTGSVARVEGKSFQSQPMTQLTDMLTGTVAGFNASQSTSASGGSSMQIRGPKSLNASTSPMIVLDGVIFNGSIADINPADIESMDVLKDASSTAVFGAKSAAGIIMVTTKKGKKGKPKVSVSANVGITEVTNDYKPYDQDGYLTFKQDALRATNPSNPAYYYDNPASLREGVTLDQWRKASNNPQADNVNEWLSRLRFFPIEVDNYLAGKTVDWYKEVIQKGKRQNYDVSISGGSEHMSYYWSLGYQDNEGVLRGDQFSTIRSRLNLDFKIANWLTAGINTQFADRNESAVQANLAQMYVMSPYGSMFDETGDVSWYPNSFAVANPMINYYGQDRYRKINSFFTSIYTKVKLPFDIEYKLSFQPRFQFLKDYNFWSSKTLEGGSIRSNGYGTRLENAEYEWITDNLLTWKKKIGIHELDVTLLYSVEEGKTWSSLSSNQSFVPNQNLGFHGIQFGTRPAVSSTDTRITGNAAMGRINYSLMDRYLITASIRRDGYSAFGNNQPYGYFPAAAVAWKISEEKFFNLDFINQMKLRLSWGVNGNRDIGAYSAIAQLASTLYYDGANTQVGVYNTTLANNNLAWEKTRSLNFGIDLGLLQNRLEVSAEVYDMTTTDLLMNRLLPEITGFKNITSNLGQLGNKGLEFSISTMNVENSNWSWNTSLVYSMNRNKIKKLFGDYKEVTENGKTTRQELPDYSNEWFPGQALDRIWNYDVTGIWQAHEKDEAGVYRLQPGDFKATDVDNNGKYEALIDKQFLGYLQPRHRLGLRNDFKFLKNFTASVFLRGEFGHEGAFADALRAGGSDTYDRRNTVDIPYWTPENPINDFARLNTNTNVFGGGIKFYKPRSFVRVQDVSISYQIPNDYLERIKVSQARIYASVRNLYSFNKWPGWDPESMTMPMPRNFTLGVNFTL